MDIVGDYIYSGENYDDGIAKRYAEYCFNEIKEDSNIKTSVPILGALTNYFAKCYAGDKKVNEESTIIIADHPTGNPNRKFSIGESTNGGIVLEKDHFLKMSLTSEKSLDKSRTFKENDIYSLMMVTFHELTHDHQKNMVEKGEKNSSAMSYILNKVLNKDGLQCYIGKDADGATIKASYYDANHDNDEIEIQADEESWMQCRKFLVDHQKVYAWDHNDKGIEAKFSKRWKKCLNNRKEVSTRRVFTKKLAETLEEVSPIQYDIENLKKYTKEDPNLLKKYPQLREYVDETGNLKLNILFDKEIANVDYEGMDERTDTFGVEIGTYLLTSDTEIKRVVEYIQKNELSQKQVQNLMGNMWNVVHQDALKSRVIKKINFENYDETNARGKNQSPEKLRNALLRQYIKQCYNCTNIAELVAAKHPELSKWIRNEEDEYIGGYYQELSKEGKLDPSFAKSSIALYDKTNIPSLKSIAYMMKQEY